MASSTQADYKQEVRFAVVMYGGVSLAIYINGITQELYHLVSSTARQKAGATTAFSLEELTPTQRVYRKLSYILSNRAFREQCQQQAQQKKDLKEPYKVPDAPDDDTIETRFVIDVLSGTSAGGINAIFLGKALANNQNIDQLKELWVNEGDIGLLLNDKKSIEGLGLKRQQPPLSLLNSRRMYLKLLKAFDDMEKSKSSGNEESRFLDEAELDLFITTTDIAGLALPIRLADSVVFERRHRNVFHFKYAPKEDRDGTQSDGETVDGRNDFVAKNNPFLAFAARCTSSFPFAFEPMRLSDIDEVLDTFPAYRAESKARGASEEWLRFFNRNVVSEAAKTIPDRPYGDGGYLDNKPFSYAVDTISRREAPLPVDRKLIYIEPSPEHPEDDGLGVTEIDALRNVKAAILDLPMYETIREDLQRVMERNNLISRVNEITDAIEQDLEDARVQRPSLRSGEWEKLDLAGMVQRFGIYYIPYRRLRIEAATDELARTVARMLILDEDSAEYTAVRGLIHAWREKVYKDENEQKRDDRLETLAHQLAEVTTRQATPEVVEQLERRLRGWLQIHLSDAYHETLNTKKDGQPPAPPAKDVKTANQFLLHYDFKYWLRRLTFVRSKIDQLLQLNKVPVKDGKLAFTEKQSAVVTRLNKYLGERKYQQLSKEQRLELTNLLTTWRAEVIKLHKEFRAASRKIHSPSKTKEGSKERDFAKKLSEIKLNPQLLSYLLGTIDRDGNHRPFSKLKAEDCGNRARLLLDNEEVATRFGAQNLATDLETAAGHLREILEDVIKPAWKKCTSLWGPEKENGSNNKKDHYEAETRTDAVPRPVLSPHAEGARKFIWHYLSKFDDYDQIRFPIMYGTDGGESDVVEVFRIAPEDAPSLIDERAESKKPNGRIKLAGTSLHHFGAFLDRVWRQNDIMWGRLDGAERLITMLLPYQTDALVREALIKEAHAAILREELSTESRSQLSSLMSEALIRSSTGEPIEAAIDKVMKDLNETSPVKTRLASAMTAIFDGDETRKDDQLLTFVKLGYQVNRRLEPKALLETISRSTQTIGGIFEDLANKNGLDGKSLSWIARLGQIFWGLVQVAIPNSISNLLLTHWLYLLYMFEVVIIVGGILFSRPGAQHFGWLALAITAVANVITLLLKDLMRGRNAVKKALWVLLGITVGVLTAVGLLYVVGMLGYNAGERPLDRVSAFVSGVMDKTGGAKWYLPPIIGLGLVGLVLLILNRIGKRDSTPAPPKPEAFKPIELQKFKKRDMKDIHLKPESLTNTYSVTARLSAEPPLDWIQSFNEQWTRNHPGTAVRVYRDQVRFESAPAGLQTIWNQLQTIINSTNQIHSRAVARLNQDLEQREKAEEEKRERELDQKWDAFKKLS